ncbi:MAG TPA: VWA domain-containing protein [Gemmatimonadales bacterium]|nr:VWA domain-containing protein [Gemmatimonadales bacterium]
MRFADPAWLVLLLVPAAWAWGRWRARRRPPEERIGFPGLAFLAGAPVSWRSRWPWLPEALRALGLVLLIAALARPQVPHEVRQIRSKSRNIMIALDISSSMKAGDFKPGNRLMVARKVLGDFTRDREGDLLGLVIFAGRAFLQAPLTPDIDLLDRMLGRIDIGMLPDGTAIGTALTMCLTQLKDLPSKASVIVLITDGANNTGKVSPLKAAEAARAIGVRIHTIGVSAADTTAPDKEFIWRAGGRTPDRLTSGDEVILRRVSERSGGRYFRATDPETLTRILAAIDPIERQEVKISETRDYRELYVYALAPGMVLLVAGMVLGATRFRMLP